MPDISRQDFQVDKKIQSNYHEPDKTISGLVWLYFCMIGNCMNCEVFVISS